jgi:hypothetical protein
MKLEAPWSLLHLEPILYRISNSLGSNLPHQMQDLQMRFPRVESRARGIDLEIPSLLLLDML